MAAIPADRWAVIHSSGDAHRCVMLRVTGATTGDTVDVSDLFTRVQGGYFVAMSGGTIGAVATSSGLNLTLANAGMNADSGYLIVVGAAK